MRRVSVRDPTNAHDIIPSPRVPHREAPAKRLIHTIVPAHRASRIAHRATANVRIRTYPPHHVNAGARIAR
jgi:hypothetical protein